MDHLSSCYFCGTALDRPLQTVRLADSAGAEEAPAMTLCPPCRRKLARVFEVASVGESVNLAASGSDAGAGESTADADGISWGSPGEADEVTEESPEKTDAGETPEEILEEVSTQDAQDEADTGESAEAGETSGESSGTDEVTDDIIEAEESTGEPGEDDESDQTANETPVRDSDTSDDSAATTDESPEVAGDTSGAAGDTSDVAGDTSAAESSGGESSKRTVVEDRGGSSVSALEYNKVIRLLQNREFPIDRDEIVTIAANAYDLRRAECAAILDLAVERDVFAESDGQLYQPE